MEDQGRDNTDASSIKPVSSLLSHFEQLNKPVSEERTHQSRSQSPNPRCNHSRLNSPAPPLKIDVRHGPHKNSQDGLGGLSTTGTDGARQRPGLGLDSTTQESPSVTIEPPKSPPKPLNLNLPMSSPSDFLSAEPLQASSSPGVSSPRHFRIPSRPHTPLMDQRKSPLLPPSASSKPPEPPPPRRSAELRRDPPAKALARLPPPVNRAEKPKIPAKHNTGFEHPNDNQLVPQEPARLKSSGGHSPFRLSTSRGVSPEHDLMLLSPAMPSRPTTQEVKPLARSNTTVFDPPAIHHAVIRRGENEFNGSGVNVDRRLVHDLDDQRPALPARPSFPLPSRTSTDLARWSKAPSIALDSPHTLKSGVQVQRPTEDSNSGTSNPKRNVSNPISSNGPTLHKSHGRSMTVDQLKIQAPENYKVSSRIGPEVSDTSVTRLSHAAPKITAGNASVNLESPDPSRSNRRFPWLSHSAGEIPIKYDARLFDVVGDYACTSGTFTRVWSLITGEQIMGLSHGETIKILSVSFKASPTPDEEGHRLWLGNNVGDLLEVDIDSQSVVATKSAAHSRHEVIKIYRHTNTMWTLDDVGTLHVWAPDKTGSPSFSVLPQTFRLPKGHTFSLIVGNELWYATGKDLRIFHPTIDGRAQFQLLQRPLCQPGAGDIVSGATVNSQPDRVYFGHTDGKITMYACDTYACLGIINVSVYKVSSLAGVGQYLWAGFSTGRIYVYDTSETPWTVKKDWRAHGNPVIGVLVDRSHVWKQDRLQVVSLGADNVLKTWDGLLEEDWLESDIQARDADFCTFENIKTLVMTWNAGASTPHSLRYSEQDSNFIRDLLMSSRSPDILVFGFQELVDLEDKKATAMSFFKSKKKDSSEQERMSHQYRDWRDYLIRCLDDYMPKTELYHLLQSSTLVGLFTCIFVKSHLRDRIKSLTVTEIKRGMGGLHGNKGALVIRFILDSTSVCFVNCHLAAGQTQTKVRNYDIGAILEGENIFPVERDPTARLDSFIGGGDGSMVLDHEICIVNGDLNYRIDTMGRDAVVNTVKAGNLEKLLERDQLLVSKRKNPGFRLRYFQEMPITFNPTYKYDVGTDTYDTSEKKRAPAWCDRILYRDGHNAKRIRQFDYRRHEVRVSDHRPVSALFEMTVKSIVPEKRAAAWDKSVKRFERVKRELLRSNYY